MPTENFIKGWKKLAKTKLKAEMEFSTPAMAKINKTQKIMIKLSMPSYSQAKHQLVFTMTPMDPNQTMPTAKPLAKTTLYIQDIPAKLISDELKNNIHNNLRGVVT